MKERDPFYQKKIDVEVFALRTGKPVLAENRTRAGGGFPSLPYVSLEEMTEATRLHAAAGNDQIAALWGETADVVHDDPAPLRALIIGHLHSPFGVEMAERLGSRFFANDWWLLGCALVSRIGTSTTDVDDAELAFERADRRKEGARLIRAQALEIGNERVLRRIAERTNTPPTRAELRRLLSLAMKFDARETRTVSLARELNDPAASARLVRRLAREIVGVSLDQVQRTARLLGVQVMPEDLRFRLNAIQSQHSYMYEDAVRIARMLTLRESSFKGFLPEVCRWAIGAALGYGLFYKAQELARKWHVTISAEDALDFYVRRSCPSTDAEKAERAAAYAYAQNLLSPTPAPTSRKALQA